MVSFSQKKKAKMSEGSEEAATTTTSQQQSHREQQQLLEEESKKCSAELVAAWNKVKKQGRHVGENGRRLKGVILEVKRLCQETYSGSTRLVMPPLFNTPTLPVRALDVPTLRDIIVRGDELDRDTLEALASILVYVHNA